MSAVDDTLFEIKIAIDRTFAAILGSRDRHRDKYCPACGKANTEDAKNCSKCNRSFSLSRRD